jgi:hypothetical protein
MRRTFPLLLLFLTACITVYSAPSPQPNSAAPASVVPTPEPSQAPTAEDRLTVAETIRLCKAVHAAQELPIGCSVTYLEGKPSMFVAFENLQTATQYWAEMSEVVTAPFCQAANEGNRQAFLFVGLMSNEVGRIYSCETNEWTEWFSYDDDSY